MATKESMPIPDTRAQECKRLTSPAMVREALNRYPWPLPTRMAVQISSIAALFSTIVVEDWHDVSRVAASLALGGLTMYGLYIMSQCQALMRPAKQAAIVIGQTACALALTRLANNDMGPCIFLFAISAELQFMMRFRLALAGTAVLWVLAVIALANMNLRYAGNTSTTTLVNAGVTLAGFVFVAAFTRSAVAEVIQRHQTTILLDELNETHAQLQTYVHQVEELAVARERNRMAREIHDTLGHYLTVINVQIETAQKLGSRDAARGQAALATAKRLASECLGEVRRSVAALRHAALDEVALPEAISQLVEDWRRASPITLHVESRGTGATPSAVELAVYRALQEALTNVRKHADARNVWLHTECGPHWYQATVRDDGRGASTDVLNRDGSGGFGLQGMRERIEAVGGSVEIVTAPGAGFTLTVRVPRTSSCDATPAASTLETGSGESPIEAGAGRSGVETVQTMETGA